MAFVQGVKIEVISEHRTLPFYQDPDVVDDGKKRSFYIEAITNAKFYLQVTLTKDFDWLSGNCATVWLSFDGGKERPWNFDQTIWASNRKSLTRKLTHFSCYDPEMKMYREAYFSFGHLELDELNEADVMPAHIDRLGTIRVDIERRKMFPRLHPKASRYHKDEAGERVSIVSEKALKGKAVTNTVSMIAGKPFNPHISTHYHESLAGADGHRICVEILYRSKHVLQMLGCVPKTPSPERLLNVNASSEQEMSSVGNTSTIPTDPDQEIRDLRARLALLEQSRSAKSEPLDTKGDSSNPARGVKREQVDIREIWEVKRPKASGPIETVDLTDD
ncbi:hypothetical protein MMC27_004277 [Xylographa pallens]|nr:hypothetical protein [Xylographa pallens]